SDLSISILSCTHHILKSLRKIIPHTEGRKLSHIDFIDIIVISIINLSDENGDQFDNAFWNGAAMFYGNGNFAFDELPKSLDVATHEMSHGVIQATANLEYQDESGAINESFADVFAVLVDRNDWLLAEDVATNFWPGGALRSMSDPHNGAPTGNYNRGWQPRHVNERFIGAEDNGGVHRNSGITNYAFYLYTTSNGMSQEKTERIYYRALTTYLTRSSNFLDLRRAVVQSAEDLHGANSLEVTNAMNAFDQVGITDGGGGNQGGSSGGEQDLEINSGIDLVLHTSAERMGLEVSDGEGNDLSNGFSTSNPISKPSISDDGSLILFVADDNNIHFIFFNDDTQRFEEQIILTDIGGEGFWRNVALSRDGARVAALSQNVNKQVYVFDFSGTSRRDRIFELFNPTFTEGVESGDVLYADVIEFDHSGQFLMYDALNSLRNAGGDNIEYWDIGFMEVYSRADDNFTNGNIGKLFNQLPENVSIGNPSFSENSPYIIAFDLLEQGFFDSQFKIQAANVERSQTNVLWENPKLGYPSYSRLDDVVLFDGNDNDGNAALGIIPVGDDKITNPNESAFLFKLDASWGNWFSNGLRDLYVNVDELILDHDLKVYPNPIISDFNFEFTSKVTQ
ncbi:MAG: M4 family metallopeptidase, partial [Bacteroidota bacterium]